MDPPELSTLHTDNKNTDTKPRHAGKIWGPYDDNALARAYNQGLTNEELAIRFGRTKDAIRTRLSKLGLTIQMEQEIEKPHIDKPKNSGKRWKIEDDHSLTEAYKSGLNYDELAIKFERTNTAIVSRLIKLGLVDENDINNENPTN
jgi:hypothetical protein